MDEIRAEVARRAVANRVRMDKALDWAWAHKDALACVHDSDRSLDWQHYLDNSL